MMPGPRMTVQRAAIAERMAHLKEFVSAQQLHEDLRRSGQRIGLAPVYGTLQSLADDGKLDVLRSDAETLYRHCETTHHHHHLVCRECNDTREVSGAGVEEWARKVAEEAGFTAETHTLEIYGLCPACQKKDLE